jgi:hypothetical protein
MTKQALVDAAQTAVAILEPFELRRLRAQLAGAALPAFIGLDGLAIRELVPAERRAIAAQAVAMADAILAAMGE